MTLSIFNSILSSSAYNFLVPKIENPKIPAPRAENIFLFFNTDEESIINNGVLFDPRNVDTILVSTFDWFNAAFLSKNIFETACPVVPEDVIVLKMSSLEMLYKSNILNRRTGKNGRADR